MKRIAKQITDLVGNTPLLELRRFAPEANIIAKLESFNPASSVKDRLAKALIEDRVIAVENDDAIAASRGVALSEGLY